MSAITAMLYRESKIRATNVTFVFWDFCYPLFNLLVFGVGLTAAFGSPHSTQGVDYNSFFLAGVLGMASFAIASNSSWSFFLDRDNGIFYEMLTYPMSRAEYLLGKLVFNVGIAVAQAVLTIGVGAAVLGIRLRFDLFGVLAVGIVIGTAGWFFFYTILALKIRRNDVFNSVTSALYFVFLFFSSMFYPLGPLPAALRRVAMANPLTWEIDLLRYGSIGLGEPRRLAVEAGAFVVFVMACFVYAVRTLNEE
ncbi:MAG TPA: ABC transporter permease [Candidatus Limnocylindrales bacterium]|nr:ABC transporter permease [Candidatus Limnocylindrales bacterium]